MKQKYTSKDTSINGTKLPRIYHADIPAGATVLDYGCGKYVDHLQKKAKERGWIWQGYDPFNYNTAIINANIRYVICSNVLNVIAEDEVVNDVINICMMLCSDASVFTIYERKGDGVGCRTGEDQWQRNEKIEAYIERIRSLGFDPYKKDRMIWVPKKLLTKTYL